MTHVWREHWLATGWVALSAAILMWNVLLAGQIARARRHSRSFLAVTSLCGLLIVPGMLIVLASNTSVTGRVVHLVAWIWPLVVMCFALQSGYALLRGMVTPLVAAPIFAFNLTLFIAAVTRYATDLVPALPAPLVGTAVAESGAMGLLFGRAALWSPWLVALPLLAPAFPARWRLGRSLRATFAVGAGGAVVLMAMEFPRAVHAAESFAPFGSERLQERPRGDFRFGLHILPTLNDAPPAIALERDLALVDTLGAAIVGVTVTIEGARPLVLDSLANALDDLRRDSVALAVTLGYALSDGAEYRRDPGAYMRGRLAMVEQVMRRLRPDVLIPALDPEDAGRAALVDVTAAWWREYHTEAAAMAHRLRPRTRVALAASSFTARDSALYVWGARAKEIDMLGFSLAPSFGGGSSLAARLRLAERWMQRSVKDQWVFSARGFPRTFGEDNQDKALWGILAWATSRPRVRAVMIDGAGDYDALDGLRAPGGRLRPAATTVARARAAMAETTEGR